MYFLSFSFFNLFHHLHVGSLYRCCDMSYFYSYFNWNDCRTKRSGTDPECGTMPPKWYLEWLMSFKRNDLFGKIAAYIIAFRIMFLVTLLRRNYFRKMCDHYNDHEKNRFCCCRLTSFEKSQHFIKKLHKLLTSLRARQTTTFVIVIVVVQFSIPFLKMVDDRLNTCVSVK